MGSANEKEALNRHFHTDKESLENYFHEQKYLFSRKEIIESDITV